MRFGRGSRAGWAVALLSSAVIACGGKTSDAGAAAGTGSGGGGAPGTGGVGTGGTGVGGSVSGAGGSAVGGSGGGTACNAIDDEVLAFFAGSRACSTDGDCTTVYTCSTLADACNGAVYINWSAVLEWDYLGQRWYECNPNVDCSVCPLLAPPPGCNQGRCGPRSNHFECTFDACARYFSGHPTCTQAICDQCCTTCQTEWCNCQSDMGCAEIMACAFATGCNDVECYQPSTCQAVIDAWGGLASPSTSLAQQLGQCAQNSGCSGR